MSKHGDTTKYQLASAANRKHLEKSIKELQKGKGKEFTVADLKKGSLKEMGLFLDSLGNKLQAKDRFNREKANER